MCPYNGPKQLLLAYQGGYKDQNGADKKGFLLLLILSYYRPISCLIIAAMIYLYTTLKQSQSLG